MSENVMHFKMEESGRLVALFMAKSVEEKEKTIEELRIEFPDGVATHITGGEYYELMAEVMPEENTW
jgi:leucyl aminopeptidase (aminopeptidase T)